MCADDQTVHMTESKQADALSLFIHRLTFSGTPCCSWGVCRGAKRMPWKAQGALIPTLFSGTQLFGKMFIKETDLSFSVFTKCGTGFVDDSYSLGIHSNYILFTLIKHSFQIF